MLTEERYQYILEYLQAHGSVTVAELTGQLGASESTIRRDLNALGNLGKLSKVHGGATALHLDFSYVEHPIETKAKLYVEEKRRIGQYAAQTIRKDDFLFLDAGTTTGMMIDYITEPSIQIVTNGFSHAQRLARRGFKVFLIGGQIKTSTEAVVGSESLRAIAQFHFTKCFLGVNGIGLTSGFTTPDLDEANVKRAVAQHSYVTYILADHSKFDKVSSVSFAPLSQACILTDREPDPKFTKHCIIKAISPEDIANL